MSQLHLEYVLIGTGSDQLYYSTVLWGKGERYQNKRIVLNTPSNAFKLPGTNGMQHLQLIVRITFIKGNLVYVIVLSLE